jgi:hypothetical protein
VGKSYYQVVSSLATESQTTETALSLPMVVSD